MHLGDPGAFAPATALHVVENNTPTKRSDSQTLVEYENSCPSKRIINQGMSYDSLWIPTFEV